LNWHISSFTGCLSWYRTYLEPLSGLYDNLSDL
jgi:hypothetical protein